MNPVFTPELIHTCAESVLERTQNPVIRIRLLRDVLHQPGEAETLSSVQALQEILSHQCVDGTWGRFHSQDSALHSPIPTTEWAIQRALALGLAPDSAPLCRAADTMASILRGKQTWIDPPEKHDRWPWGIRTITAGMLSLLDREHPALDETWQAWVEIATTVFKDGRYDAQREQDALFRQTGAKTFRGRFLLLKNKYTYWLLSARPDRLPTGLDEALVRWMWQREDGMGYLPVPLHLSPASLSGTALECWLQALEVLVRFRSAANVAKTAFDALWALRQPDGWWDLGPRWSGSYALPLSSTWQKPLNRRLDWTTRILTLLNQVA